MFLFEKIAKKFKLWVPTPDTPQEIIDYSKKLVQKLKQSYAGNAFLRKYHTEMRKYEKAYRKKLSKNEAKANSVRLPGGLTVDKRDFGNLGIDNMSPNTMNMGVLNGMIFNDPKTVMESYHNTMQMANAYRPQATKNITDYAIPAAGVGVAGVGLYSALKSKPSMPMPMYSSAPGYGYGYPPRGLQYEQDYYH